ncbi:MAG: MAPEG family protein [Pseudomonadales bacterium]|nr:MAPEG family protein [Pseudomonadales bacterium]
MVYFYWYVSIIVLVTTLLAANVSRVRLKEKIGNGDGGNRDLRKAIRSHMNTIEHGLPFGLIVLALAMQNTSTSILAIMTFGFIATRLINSYGMLMSKFRIRQITAGITYLFQIIGCLIVMINI